MMGKKAAAKKLARAEHDATASVAKARDTAPVAALGKVGDLADQPPLLLLSCATVAFGLLTRRSALVRTGVRMLVAEVVATGLKTVVKRSIDRARPAKALESGDPELGHGRGSGDTAYNSFPSGHTAGAVAVAQAVAHEQSGAALPARLAAVGAGAIQLPRGKHYLSDVAAGAAIGWLAERIAGAAIAGAERAWARRGGERDALVEAEAHPS